MNQLQDMRNVWLEVHIGLGISLMDHLFNRLDGAYPNRWRSSFPSETSIKNWRESWAEAFADEKITPDEIKRGIAACRKQYDWPPSLTEFIKACRPPINHEQAFSEAVKQLHNRDNGKDTWSNPAIYWAAQSIGTFDMFNLSWPQIKNRWIKELDEFMADEVPPVPAAAPQLPSPGKTSIAPEVAHKRIEEAVSKISEKTDHKAWARKILDNPNDYPEISIRFAKEALGARA